jgi:hypothetical protein
MKRHTLELACSCGALLQGELLRLESELGAEMRSGLVIEPCRQCAWLLGYKQGHREGFADGAAHERQHPGGKPAE